MTKSADNKDMESRAILITEQIKEAINSFLGAELIPTCAIGSELCIDGGSLILRTFKDGHMEGYRKLDSDGQITNIIAEFRPA